MYNYGMKTTLLSILAAVSAFVCAGEQYKLKYDATVEVVGAAGAKPVVKKLKAGTIIQLAEAKKAEPKKPAKMSPAVFMTTRPADGATFVAEVSTSTYLDSGFGDKKDWLPVHMYLYYPNGDDYEIFNGAVRKDSEAAKMILKKFEESSKTMGTVSVRHVSGIDDAKTVEVLSFAN